MNARSNYLLPFNLENGDCLGEPRRAGERGGREGERKRKFVAIACIRKLLAILNVMLNNNQPWIPTCLAKNA